MTAADADMPEFPDMAQAYAADDGLAETLGPVCAAVAGIYSAELTAQVEALDRWLADHPDIASGEPLQSEDRTRRPRGQLTFDLMGTPVTTSLRAFSVFKLQSVTDAFDRLDPAGRESVRAWLAPLGLAQWLDLKARRRIERIGNREVWAGLPE
jgi:hypothetical protein